MMIIVDHDQSDLLHGGKPSPQPSAHSLDAEHVGKHAVPEIVIIIIMIFIIIIWIVIIIIMIFIIIILIFIIIIMIVIIIIMIMMVKMTVD